MSRDSCSCQGGSRASNARAMENVASPCFLWNRERGGRASQPFSSPWSWLISRLEPAPVGYRRRSSGWSDQPKGSVHRRRSIFNELHACAHPDRHKHRPHHNHHNHHHHWVSQLKCGLFASRRIARRPLRAKCLVHAARAPQGGDGSCGCARCFGTRGRPSRWSSLRPGLNECSRAQTTPSYLAVGAVFGVNSAWIPLPADFVPMKQQVLRISHGGVFAVGTVLVWMPRGSGPSAHLSCETVHSSISWWRHLGCDCGGQCCHEPGSFGFCEAFSAAQSLLSQLVLTSGGFRVELSLELHAVDWRAWLSWVGWWLD